MAASRIQRRLLLSYLALLVGALLPAAFLLGSWVGDEARHGLERALLGQARSLALEVERAPPGDWTAWTLAMGQALQARVTVIAPDGAVLGDSEVPRERLGTLENHGQRPEVMAALGGGEGIHVRHSATLGRDMMYVAVPVGSAGAAPGTPGRARREVLRLALPLDQVTRTVARGYGAVLLAGLLALGLAIGLGTLLALRWSRPVVAMTQAARAMTRGNFHAPLPTPGDDELGDLVHVLGTLRGQLATHLEELRNEGVRLRTILHAMGEGVALVSDGRITVANPAFAELLGAPIVEGRSLLEAVRLVSLHEAIDRAIGTGTPVSSEIEMGQRALCFRIVPLSGALDERSAREGVIVLLDVTEARRLERMRRDFVANASHELRTPVAAVLAAAETLASGAGEEPAARAKFLDILQRHALRLSRLTSDLLELSRLEAGHEPRIESVSVAAVLETVRVELGPRAQAKSITLESALAPDLPEVAAEPAGLEQILNNLIDNAIKYTPAGGRVTVTARADERDVTLVVADTGPGIPEPHLGRIFERFYRVDSARSRELGGTGLGLAIVKHLALSMGGMVGVESEVRRGSRFLVRLPRAR